MSAATKVYNVLCKRTSTFVLTIMAGTFFFERTFDLASQSLFENVNRGKLWNHIKHKYQE